MAKGYPGRKRAQKAFWRGVKSTTRRNPFNPYTHPRLKVLFDRGLTEAKLNPGLLQRLPERMRPRQRQLPPPSQRSFSRRRDDRRDPRGDRRPPF